jgi:hypothetical protein
VYVFMSGQDRLEQLVHHNLNLKINVASRNWKRQYCKYVETNRWAKQIFRSTVFVSNNCSLHFSFS